MKILRVPCKRKKGQADMTKIIIAFCNFPKAFKSWYQDKTELCGLWYSGSWHHLIGCEGHTYIVPYLSVKNCCCRNNRPYEEVQFIMYLTTQYRRSFCTGSSQLTLPQIVMFRFKFDRLLVTQHSKKFASTRINFLSTTTGGKFGGY